jgi:hypothetical protein
MNHSPQHTRLEDGNTTQTSSRHIKYQDGQSQFVVFIATMMKNKPKARLMFKSSNFTLKICVLPYQLLNLANDGWRVFITVKHDDCRLRIAPSCISKQLVDSDPKDLRSFPSFTFPNKNIPIFCAN